MKLYFYSVLLISLAACNASPEQKEPVVKDSVTEVAKPDSAMTYIHSFSDTALESKITAKLMKLPFVIKANSYIDSFSEHRHGIAFMVNKPEQGDTELSVQAGYNGDQRFETYFRFYVNPQTLDIKVYDAVKDKRLTVKEYTKTHR